MNYTLVELLPSHILGIVILYTVHMGDVHSVLPLTVQALQLLLKSC